MKTKQTLDTVLTLALLVVALLLIGALGMYAFYHNPPVTYSNLPFPTELATYHTGEEIYLYVDYCKNTTAPFSVSVAFVDGFLYSVPERTMAGGPVGCKQILTNIATLPDALPPGEYYLLGKNEYDINFFITRTVEWRSQPFTVIEQ